MFDLAKQMTLDSLTMRVFVSVIGMLHYGTTKYLIDIIQPTLNENVVDGIGWIKFIISLVYKVVFFPNFAKFFLNLVCKSICWIYISFFCFV